MIRFTVLRGLLIAVAALLLAGCQSVAFGIANHALPAADASVVYDAGNGLALDIYKPRKANPAGTPVVVFFYGGGWKSGKRGQYRFVGHRLAQMGVLAVVADYRTYPRSIFPGFMEDGAAPLAAVQDPTQPGSLAHDCSLHRQTLTAAYRYFRFY